MNNDLISREALKKALTEAHINMTLTFDIATFNCVMNTIDNAPTVERLQGDLISREYVKLFVCEYEKFNGKETEIVKAVPIIAIDNAPTVKAENASLLSENDLETIRTILNAHIGCLCNNGQHTQAIVIEQVRDRLFGVLQSKNERPQGEWNEIQAGMFACPFCGARPHKDFKNFCAKCGAEMQKGGAE